MSTSHFKPISKSKGYSSDYSTFIQELQTAADKLMSEVFEQSSIAPMPSPIRASQNKIHTEPSFDNYKSRDLQFLRKSSSRNLNKTSSIQNSRAIHNFMDRLKYYSKQKDKKMRQLHHSQQQLIQTQHTFKPKINRSSERLNIKPIKDRCLQIQQTKQKRLFQQRADKKMKQQNQINKISFQPKINTKTQNKTFQDYYDEKVKWQKKRLQQTQKRKHLMNVKKHTECVFKPNLQTQKSGFYKKNQKLNGNSKVQDRLLQRLQMSVEKKMKL